MRLFSHLSPRDQAQIEELERQVLDAVDEARRKPECEQSRTFLDHVDSVVHDARSRLNGMWPKPKGA